MKPVGYKWLNKRGFVQFTTDPEPKVNNEALYHIPKGYKLVPIEPDIEVAEKVLHSTEILIYQDLQKVSPVVRYMTTYSLIMENTPGIEDIKDE